MLRRSAQTPDHGVRMTSSENLNDANAAAAAVVPVRPAGVSPGLALRQAQRQAGILVSPVAHDALTARLIEQAGFTAFNIGGSSLLAARHALPDLGLAALGEMSAAIRDVVEAVRIPALVDGDDGYGDVKNVVRTVAVLERIGTGGLLLEDQDLSAKRPGDSAARSISSPQVFAQKVRAAVATRSDPDYVIIARTDAIGIEGLDGALRRADKALSAGADGIFVAGMRREEEFAAVGRKFAGCWNVAALFERAELALTPQDLKDLNYSQAVYPAAIIQRVVRTITAVLSRLRQLERGERRDLADTTGELAASELSQAVGLHQWEELERRLAGGEDG